MKLTGKSGPPATEIFLKTTANAFSKISGSAWPVMQAREPNAASDQGGVVSEQAPRRPCAGGVDGEDHRRPATILCRSRELLPSARLCASRQTPAPASPSPSLAEGQDVMGRGQLHDPATVAPYPHRTPVAVPAVGRHDPKAEPDALTRTSGSVRGASGNRRPCRDDIECLKLTPSVYFSQGPLSAANRPFL